MIEEAGLTEKDFTEGIAEMRTELEALDAEADELSPIIRQRTKTLETDTTFSHVKEILIMHQNDIGTIIVDCAVNLHIKLGPGLLETVYEAVLAKQLKLAGLTVHRQVLVPIIYEGLYLDEGFRADLIVNESVIIELKSVETIHPVHKKQLLTYLKLTGHKLGYLLNFGDELMKNGITRIINGTL